MLETWSQCTIQSFKRFTGEYPGELKLFYETTILWKGGIAQLVERLLCKQDVIGSNPVTSTNFLRATARKRKLFYYGPVAQLVRARA